MVKVKDKREMVPPDGGWGWIVCFAYALNNIIILPLISGFGLIFQETFATLDISATHASIIINVNHAFGMVLSLFNGPLLRSYGYRKVAVAGALFVSSGILLTSRANSFSHFLVTYSLMTSIGVALVMSAFSLAINSFFRKNRGKAMAVGMSITGLGPIFMPQVINALIGGLGTQGAVMVLGALSLHSLIAALLLRPVKWYMKPAEDVEDAEKEENEEKLKEGGEPKNYELKELTKSVENLSENEDDYLDNAGNLRISMRSLQMSKERELNGIAKRTKSNPDMKNDENINSKAPHKWWDSSAAEINPGSSVDIFDDNNRRPSFKTPSPSHRARLASLESKSLIFNGSSELSPTVEIKEKKSSKSFGYKIVKFFDLGLLKDPIFVNIMLGISLAACAEINFALLTPFILNDLKFTTPQIAAVMSVIAFSDIIFRFLSPFIGDLCYKSARVMYVISLIMLIATRTTIFFATSYTAMLMVGLGLGVAKGMRSVYMSLVIPNHVPIERLAFASGIQMVTNGIILMTIGPLLGFIRDKSGSYNISIVFINIITSITILLWTGEFLYIKYFVKVKNTKT